MLRCQPTTVPSATDPSEQSLGVTSTHTNDKPKKLANYVFWYTNIARYPASVVRAKGVAPGTARLGVGKRKLVVGKPIHSLGGAGGGGGLPTYHSCHLVSGNRQISVEDSNKPLEVNSGHTVDFKVLKHLSPILEFREFGRCVVTTPRELRPHTGLALTL